VGQVPVRQGRWVQDEQAFAQVKHGPRAPRVHDLGKLVAWGLTGVVVA